jgi:large subunit ribosomal protein L22
MEKQELIKNTNMEKNLSPTLNLVVCDRNLAISPQKLRLVANLVRKKEVNQALNTLLFLSHKCKGARMLRKILQGANKQTRKKSEKDLFYINKVQIDRGIIRKKLLIRARGNADTLRKTNSRLFLCLGPKEEYK